MSMRFVLLILYNLVIGIGLCIAQKVVYVDGNALGLNNGTSWQNAFIDLNDALNNSAYGDQVWVAEGKYLPDPTGSNRNKRFELPQGVKLYGSFLGNETSIHQRPIFIDPLTVLSGNIGNSIDSTDNSYTVLYLNYPDTTTLVDGFEISHGYASSDTSFTGGTPILNGGGVFIEGKAGYAYATFVNCLIKDNFAKRNGGGVFIKNQSSLGNTPLFSYCKLMNNKCDGNGGAISWAGGSQWDRGIEFDHCIFIGNRAKGQSGVLFSSKNIGEDTIEFIGCNFEKNVGEVVSTVIGFDPNNISLNIAIESCNFKNNFRLQGNSAASLCTTIGFSIGDLGNVTISNNYFIGNFLSPGGGSLFDIGATNEYVGKLLFSNNNIDGDNCCDINLGGKLFTFSGNVVRNSISPSMAISIYSYTPKGNVIKNNYLECHQINGRGPSTIIF